MKTLESMKQFIRENNFTALVNELVTGADMDVADAVEYVYDMKTLSKAQFARQSPKSRTKTTATSATGRLTVHSRKSASPLRTTSSSTVWPVWLRSLNFFAFVCPF